MQSSLLLLLVLLTCYAAYTHSCTTIIVGRLASSDGSTLVTHNNDCTDCDTRLATVPPRPIHTQHDSSELLDVYACKFGFPRKISSSHGLTYSYDNTMREGFHDHAIPQEIAPLTTLNVGNLIADVVKRYDDVEPDTTYRYIDGTYGIANEHQLAMGESTCSAKLIAYGAPLGVALFDISALSRVALERCKTARCAIAVMGALAEKYGYYGANDPPEESGDGMYEESGEALTIIDTTEAWVFHILPDDTQTSAVWAAQRLKDDHVTVVANKFIIQRMDFSDSDNYMYSDNILDVCKRAKLCGKDTTEKTFDFSAVYAPDGEETPAHNNGWADRRTWRVYSLVAARSEFKPTQEQKFPFSVAAEHPLTLDALFAMKRDHFEGTEYDLSTGIASGPYNNPNRYDRNANPAYADGYFERAISLHRTTYSYVAQSRAWLPDLVGGVLWFAQHAPHSSVYIPLLPATDALPSSYTHGTIYKLERDVSWWSYVAVTNYAEKQWSHIMLDIQDHQLTSEGDARMQLHDLSEGISTMRLGDSVEQQHGRDLVTDFTTRIGDSATATQWRMLDFLLTKYRDGQRVMSFEPPTRAFPLFYPVQWLQEATSYFDNGAIQPSGQQLPPAPQPPSRKPSHAIQQFNILPSNLSGSPSAAHSSDSSFAGYVTQWHMPERHDAQRRQDRVGHQRRRTVAAGTPASDVALIERVTSPQHPASAFRLFQDASWQADAHATAADMHTTNLHSQSSHHVHHDHGQLHRFKHLSSSGMAYSQVLLVTASAALIAFVCGQRYGRTREYQSISSL